ncbi:hypothetical protein CRE_31379 [Caenorhabditis remanei]|uniref:Uncharacterized protein n=1 Tax=Caenorhabditis remanei TaxID=31234 RepID=E3MYA6_CAERE|nr:hypothetical protein CRE_31379 [Caenorhabditis remanei]
MRRISPLLPYLLVLLGYVHGFASAPGTYPEEEMKSTSDMEVPKNPYQNGWTGYDFYYEKDPKKAPSSPGGSGKMPAFQSIESISTDRETPEDPGSTTAYQASGSESSGHNHKSSISSSTTSTTTKSSAKVMVSPSSSTKGLVTTSVPTTRVIPTKSVSTTTTTTTAPSTVAQVAPESGSDLSAADNLELLYGGEKKDPSTSTTTQSPTTQHKISIAHDAPPPPKNLLTTLFEKKPRTMEPENPYGGYDDKGPLEGYESGYEAKSKGSAPGTEPRSTNGVTVTPDYGQHEKQQSDTTTRPPVRAQTPYQHPDHPAPSYPTTHAPSSSDPYEHLPIPTAPTYFTADTPPNPRHPHARIPESSQIEYNEPVNPPTRSGPSSSTGYQETPSSSNGGYSNPMHRNPGHSPGSEPSLPGSMDTGYPESQTPAEYSNPASNYPGSSSNYGNPANHALSPGHSSGHPDPDPSYPTLIVPVPAYQPDILDYGSRENNHVGKVPPMSSKFTHPPDDTSSTYSNSNNALSPRDPYDHFGTAHAPSPQPSQTMQNNFEEFPDDEMDGGYGSQSQDDLHIVPLRSHSTTTTNHEVRAQISEIDRIAESFENSAREPVEYEQKITSESSKGITVEAGKEIQKHFGRKSRKCCSCCDEKQPVSRNIETNVEPLHVQQAVDPSRQLGEVGAENAQNYVPLDNTVGGSAYVQRPQAPVQQPQQTYYQQPFQQYQPQYPQSYAYQQPACGCQPPPQNCCPPPAPCCLPTIPCCPPIPCCPQPKICCQPTPVCLPPPTCCSINFKLPTIPICGRACPSCPCRRRVHKSRRLKRHAISTNCNQCSAAGEPWKQVLHHREKRAAPGCSSGFSTMQQNSCGTCGASNLRSPRVKRMGCLPCLGRKKRDTEENSHIRVKRMGCLPCLGGGRKKRSALSGGGCSQCNSLGHLFNRYKRSLFGCNQCAPQPSCGCQGRKKRSVTVKIIKRAPEQCDASCCDYSRCLNRQKKETLVPFM